MSLVMLALAVSLTATQPGREAFAGTWIATHAGTTFLRLELRVGDGIEGGIGLGNIRVDTTGAVDEVTAVPGDLKPIFDVTLKGSTLSFASKDGHDTDRFEVMLTGAGAEIRFVFSDLDRQALAAEGVPVPKPIRLRRVP